MCDFTFGEEWGPFPCEHKGCNEINVFVIRLTNEEYDSLPEKNGPKVAAFIFDKKLGIALCDRHR